MCSGDFFIVAPAFYEVIELKKKKEEKEKKILAKRQMWQR